MKSPRGQLHMDMDNSALAKRLLPRLLRDVSILAVLGVPLLLVHVLAPTYQRGFYCGDDSIRYPFKTSTISSRLLQGLSLGGLLLFVAVTELTVLQLERCLSSPKAAAEYVFHHRRAMVRLAVRAYTFVGFGLIGMIFCQWATVAPKKLIGRLRPHFLDLCRPRLRDTAERDGAAAGLAECLGSLAHAYVSNFTCAGNEAVRREHPQSFDYYLSDSRHSFPSGHSSQAFFTAVYLALYLQTRLRQPLWRPLALPAVQFGLLLAAFLCALTRISDYKHHPTDVAAGALIGILSGWLTSTQVGRFFHDQAEVRYKALAQVAVVNGSDPPAQGTEAAKKTSLQMDQTKLSLPPLSPLPSESPTQDTHL